MRPLEILSSIPKWKNATSAQIVESPAFAVVCRIGEETATLRLGAVEGGDTLDLSVLFGDIPHVLRISRSPRFQELDKVWDSRADVPEQILLALAEKDCGALFQMLENVVRRQMRLVGLAGESASDERMLFAQVSDISFALTRSDAVLTAFGILRNLDVSNEDLRGEAFSAEEEYAAFALSAADMASLAVGDALLLPEVGSASSRLVVDGRFVVGETGVSLFSDDGRCRVVSAEPRTVTLGELFDSADDGSGLVAKPGGAAPGQLRLVQNGKTVACGRFGSVGEQPALIIEAMP